MQFIKNLRILPVPRVHRFDFMVRPFRSRNNLQNWCSQACPEETSAHNLLTTQPFRKSRKVWQNVKETIVSDAGHGVAEMFVQCFTTMQKYQIYCERLQVNVVIYNGNNTDRFFFHELLANLKIPSSAGWFHCYI